MWAKAALRFSEPPRSSKDTAWARARLSVVLPLLVVVAASILCIVVAGFTSAQRADEVAIERERNQFTRALGAHGYNSSRRLRAAFDRTTQTTADLLHRRFEVWRKMLEDHDQLLIADEGQHFSEAEIVVDHRLNWRRSGAPDLRPLVRYLRGQDASLPAAFMPLDTSGIAARADADANQAGFLARIEDRVAIVSSVVVQQGDFRNPIVVLGVLFVDDRMLSEISIRLDLERLRVLSSGNPANGETVATLAVPGRSPIGVYAWQSRRPGAAILQSVVPFIGVVLIGFALLVGLMIRYMRNATKALVSGEGRLRHLALHDPLSGLPNRTFFGEHLERTIEEVRRSGENAALFYIDLDHFKDVNDTLGHPVGDELICNVTRRLATSARPTDMVARLGGDEFAIVASKSASPQAIGRFAERLITRLCEPFSVNDHTIVIGASIGIALIEPDSGAEAADLMRFADMALYRAKNEGRNRACIYDEAMNDVLSQRKQMEQDLRKAIESNTVELLYQPIMDAAGQQIVGVEALARWDHPIRGAVSPAEFIPVAEHSGLIVELGDKVLRRALLDGLEWPGLTVSVNVSPLQFRRIDFVEKVERILQETGFDPARLELELTESTFIGNSEGAEVAMLRLRSLGVRLALDDFGTGYSSLQYLRRFPFDRLKIDRSFVASIDTVADSAAIVHAIVGLGRGLRMKVTAEGVETDEQHLFLRAAGVHCMQGYRFGRPQTAQRITRRLKSGASDPAPLSLTG